MTEQTAAQIAAGLPPLSTEQIAKIATLLSPLVFVPKPRAGRADVEAAA